MKSERPKTSDQKLYSTGDRGQIRAEIAMQLTTREHEAPSIAECRHAVLQIKGTKATGEAGYVVYDRLLCRIVNGVYYYGPDDALGVAQWYNEDPEAPQDMSPNGDALGLLYPKRES